MDSFISWLEKNQISDNSFESENLFVAISPHDDYLYAGRIYYQVYKIIKAKEIIIFGVTHGTVRKAINDPQNILILDEFDFWKGPYGNVKVSDLRNEIKSKLDTGFYEVNNLAHSLEHSIEALIPFLQHYNREIKITPVMVTRMPFDRMDSIAVKLSEVILNYANEKNLKPGKDLFILISNDANHYGEDFNNYPYGLDESAHKAATYEDKRIAHKFNGEISTEKISDISNELWTETEAKEIYPLWCGRYPIVLGLLTSTHLAKKLGKDISGKLFCYSDTFTEKVLSFKETKMGMTAPFSLRHWVGFLSAGFYLR
ncbi:AmmeMemoRadiSam system protein B [Ignavibacterium album]|nr:AmmeMemoRadiSam system protein B [Ignavibacterium album]